MRGFIILGVDLVVQPEEGETVFHVTAPVPIEAAYRFRATEGNLSGC